MLHPILARLMLENPLCHAKGSGMEEPFPSQDSLLAVLNEDPVSPINFSTLNLLTIIGWGDVGPCIIACVVLVLACQHPFVVKHGYLPLQLMR